MEKPPTTEEGPLELTLREAMLPEKLRVWRAKLSMYAKPVEERPGALPLVNAACEDPVRKPDAGNLPVRFDEGRGRQRSLAIASHSVSPLLLYRLCGLWSARQSLVSLVIRKEHHHVTDHQT